MNLKEMIENRIEENNILIKKLEDENDEMKLKLFDYNLTGYVGNCVEIKVRVEENEFLKELLTNILINTTKNEKSLL